MPVLKKEIELNDGRKVWVRQASGMDKLKIEAKQGRVMRKCRHFGSDLSKWTDEQMDEFMELCEKEGCGFEAQVEMVRIINVIRGDDNEGAVPLG